MESKENASLRPCKLRRASRLYRIKCTIRRLILIISNHPSQLFLFWDPEFNNSGCYQLHLINKLHITKAPTFTLVTTNQKTGLLSSLKYGSWVSQTVILSIILDQTLLVNACFFRLCIQSTETEWDHLFVWRRNLEIETIRFKMLGQKTFLFSAGKRI